MCVVWVSTVTNDARFNGQEWQQIVGYWLLMNVPLMLAWWIIAAEGPPGPSIPMLPAVLALLVTERIGRGATFGEYKYGILGAAQWTVPYAIAAVALLALGLSVLLPPVDPWLKINVAILSLVVVVARTPALLL